MTKEGDPVSDTSLHSIRFKDGDVEFELIGSASDVEKVWVLLEEHVTRAFATERPVRGRTTSNGSDGDGSKTPTKTRRSSRTAVGTSDGGSAARSDILQKLLGASIEDFPEIGDEPSAFLAGLATLSWARNELEIDGLQISEIHKFLSKKLRLSYTTEAYRFAFKQHPRMFNTTGRPTTFHLMSRGDKELSKQLAELANKGT
jgi:hypothetical protein